MRSLVGISDYFVLVSATNRRQAQTIVDTILAELPEKSRGGKTEGYSLGWWILLDFGAVIVHVLQEEARGYYGLDHLWADAPQISLGAAKTRRKKAQAG